MSPSIDSLPAVGIDKMSAYPCTLALDLEELAVARGHDVSDLRENLLVRRRSVNPLWEDPVTMAVNAAHPMLTDEDRARIELLIVATESGVDQGKSMATFAHRYLGLQPNCRSIEAKQACYSGTGSVMMACHWLRSQRNPEAKALVITSDQSRMNLGKPYEYVTGAGSVALLLSRNPRVLTVELDKNGYFTHETWDTFRPTTTVETGNGETSLYCYLDALEGAYEDYVRRVGEVDFGTYFARNIYHVPFGGITYLAHRTLLKRWRRLKKSEAWEHFASRSLPALVYNREIGATYSGSSYMALLGLLAESDDLPPGSRVGLFSYGSGSVGEFYSGLTGPEARQIVRAARTSELLAARMPISVLGYETLEQKRHHLIDCGDYESDLTSPEGLYERRYRGQGLLVLRRVQGFIREYERS